MKRAVGTLTFALSLASMAPSARALVLLDTGYRAGVDALRASTDEHFTCGPDGCDEDFEIYAQSASRFTLANGGLATGFTFAGHSGIEGANGIFEIYRAQGAKLVADSSHLVWSSSNPSTVTDLGPDPLGYPFDIEQFTFSDLNVELLAGDYWLKFWTLSPTFGRYIALKAGDGDSVEATRYLSNNGNPGGWAYAPGPEVSLRIDASRIDPAPTNVPEPAGWVLIIGGFGLAGAALRRRNAPPSALIS